MSSWDFKIRGFAGDRHPRKPPGAFLVATAHKGEASASIEIEAWQARMRRGEVSRAELIDMRPDGSLTNYNIGPETKIPWSWSRS
jgi:hypothetical protein